MFCIVEYKVCKSRGKLSPKTHLRIAQQTSLSYFAICCYDVPCK